MFAYETWLRQCYGMHGSQWNPATNLYWFIKPNAAKLMEQCLMVPLDSGLDSANATAAKDFLKAKKWEIL